MSTQTATLAAASIPNRWWKLAIPSLADLFFVAVLCWSFALGAYGWSGLLMDGDIGTHIRIGDYILSHGSVPSRDFLSFSKPGQEWYAFEWLTEVIFSALHSFAGLKAIVLMAGVVITATFTLLLLHAMWRGANLVIGLALVLMAINASSIHFHARPHIFTMFFVAAATWLLAADRRRRTRALWLLIPCSILWTNLHGGFVILFALIGLLLAGCLAERLIWGPIGSRSSDLARYGLLALGCAAASLANPYGIKLHLFLGDYLSSNTIRNGVQEFQSPSFRSESMTDFMILLFLGLAVLGPLLRKRHITEVLWILFLAYNALISVRHVPLFVIVAVPILAVELTGLWTVWVQSSGPGSITRTLDAITSQFRPGLQRVSLWGVVAVAALALSHTSNWPSNFLREAFPVDVVEAHADEIATSRVFTSDGWAGYLIYRNYPRQRVFFDDRHRYYGDAMILEYAQLLSGGRDWRKVLDRYDFDLVLCDAASSLASLMRSYPGWLAVEDREKVALFRRKR